MNTGNWPRIALTLWLMAVSGLGSEPRGFRRVADGWLTDDCKQCDSAASSSANGRNRYRCAVVGDRMFFVSLRGRHQPNYGFYHETSLRGGYVTAFDLRPLTSDPKPDPDRNETDLWSHWHMSPVDKTENRDDLLFVVRSRMFLLAYSRYGNLTFGQLYVWDALDDRRSIWTPLPFTVDPDAQLTTGDVRNGRMTVAERWRDQSDDQDGPIESDDTDSTSSLSADVYLLATDGWGKSVVSKLTVLFNRQPSETPVSAVVRRLFNDEHSRVDSAGSVVALAYRHRHLHAFYGERGCGFHWEKRQLMRIDLQNGTVSYVNLTLNYPHSVAPQWSFRGPMAVQHLDADWLMFSGGIPADSQIQLDRQIWLFDLDKLQWHPVRSAMVPKQLNRHEMCSAIDPVTGVVYLSDLRHGVFAANIADLRQQALFSDSQPTTAFVRTPVAATATATTVQSTVTADQSAGKKHKHRSKSRRRRRHRPGYELTSDLVDQW